ncbi:hypothetical protein ABT072_33090 [Streptomyces sp. NPDC002589]|uniref:hypothetical protein n=1 Tax=Streptomyces sp. NPDC002589 TaxID=3154420 RepID=UPI003321BFCD
MPADEVTRGTDEDGSRVRTGPRHAAPRKPLFTRFHMPAGKAIASVAMPTAVLMGMGFTSTLALADNGGSPSPSTTSKSLTANEYKDCVKALDGSKDASASPSPSASKSASGDSATPTPSASAGAGGSKDTKSGDSGKTSSPDSGSGDKASHKPTATSEPSSSSSGSGSSASSSDSATPTPSASKSGGGLLDTIGDTLGGILGGGSKDSGSPSASPTPSATPSASKSSDSASPSDSSSSGSKASDTVSSAGTAVGDTVKKATDSVKNTTGSVSKTAQDTAKAAASATPSPSASSSAPANCPAATKDQGGVDNKVPVADDPWYLDASSLLLKGSDYKGIVEVKTASGTTKKVLKFVISSGTDIGDLHQTVKDKLSGKTYHVQAAQGSTSTIRGGDTVMYTEKISGNLFGLIPMTFSPDSPPPLNLPLIYFTHVKVVQAAQFGGNLHVPGMHVYTTG